MSEKVITIDELTKRLDSERQSGKKIVTTNGVFDLLSAPHVFFLEEAKKQGDILVVGINSDESVQRCKDPKRPIVPEDQRALLVASLACVDHVFLFEDDDPRAWLPVIRPDAHVNSEEYTEKCIEADVVKEIGAELVLLPRRLHPDHDDFLSTSDIIDTIRDRYSS